MFIPGVPGSSLDENHKDWIEVLSMSQGVSGAQKNQSSCSRHVDHEANSTRQVRCSGPQRPTGTNVFREIKIEIVRR